MTFITDLKGKVSTANSSDLVSSGGSKNTAAYNIHSGTAASGTSTTITLDAGASAVDDFYNGLIVQIVGVRTSGDYNLITDYNGTTKVATVQNTWCDLPTSTTEFVIHINSGRAQEQDQSDSDISIKLSATASAIDDFYKGNFIYSVDSDQPNDIRRIVSYDGTTKVAVVDVRWEDRPDSKTFYHITGEHGTATGGTANTIELDGNQTSIAGTASLCIEINSGTGVGQAREIASLATNTLTITSNWDTTPDATSRYIIYGGWSGAFETVKDYAMISSSTIIDIAGGELGIIDMQVSMDDTGDVVRGKYSIVSKKSVSSVHTLSVASEYYRYRIIGMGTALTGKLQSIYHTRKSAKLTTFIEEKIGSSNDCDIVRAIVSGRTQGSEYKNVTLQTNGSMNTNITGPTSAFGELVVTEPRPLMQLKFTYGLNDQTSQVFTNPETIITMDTEGSSGVAQVQSIYLPQADSFTSTGAGDYFTLDDGADNPFYVWFDVDSGNTDPAPGGTGLQVDISAGESPTDVASATSAIVNGNAAFSTTQFSNIVTITNTATTSTNPTSLHIDNMPSVSTSSVYSIKGSALATTTNGAGIGDYAILRSRRTLKYRPGQGCQCRFTAIFDEPTAGTLQYGGIGNAVSALYLGYNGTEFGISRRSGGIPQIEYLQITSVAGATTGTVVVTVDGIDHMITLTDVTSVESVATEIFDHGDDYKRTLYSTELIGDSVHFISDRLTIGTNSFSFALGTATNITASFTNVSTAQNITDTFVPQNDFNVDRLDGKGHSGMYIKPTMGNVFQIEYQYLGFGDIFFYAEDPNTGRFEPFHTIKYPNRFTSPTLTHPDMRFTLFTASTTSTTPVTVQSASASLITHGRIDRFDPNFSVFNNHANIGTTTTNAVLLQLRNPIIFNGVYNQSELALKSFTITSSKSSNNTKALVIVKLIINAIPSETLSLSYVKEGQSCTLFNTPAPGITHTNGIVLFTTAIPAEGNTTVNLLPLNLNIENDKDVYIVYTVPDVSTGSLDITASLDWVEDH